MSSVRRIAALALLLPLVVACQNGGTPQQTKAATQTSKYSTGGDAADDPCKRVVSAIGYAGLMLKPAGHEDEQNFENAVIGRLAELRGITQEFGPRLPEGLVAAARTVEETTHGLAKADTPRKRQVALLKKYRAAAGQIVAGCA